MRLVLIAITTIFLFVTGSSAQETCNRHSEPAGGFSMCVPTGWTVEARESSTFKVLFAPRSTVFTANINFRSIVLSQAYPLSEFAAAAGKKAVESAKEFGATSTKFLDQSEFVTGRLKGIRIRLLSEFKGLMIATWQYLFVGKDGKTILVVTCTGLDSDRASLDPLFDRTVKTFQLDE